MSIQTLFEEGLHTGLTNAEYQKAPGLSFSGLKEFAETPAHYQAYLRRPAEAETASQRLGTLVHLRTLEPHEYDARVAIVDGNRNSNAVKEQVQAAQAAGKYVCKSDEHDLACRMADAVHAHARMREVFSVPGGVAESSIFWTEPETGIALKCRPDYLLQRESIIVDLKYYSDLNPRDLERQIFRMKYHWQAAHYLSGLASLVGRPCNQFLHCFVMDRDPFLCKVVVLGDPALDKAMHDIHPLIEQFAECKRTGIWPGYPEEVEPILLPDWSWGV